MRPRVHSRPCQEKLNPKPVGRLYSTAQLGKFLLRLLSPPLPVDLRRECGEFVRHRFSTARTAVPSPGKNWIPDHPAARTARPPRKNVRDRKKPCATLGLFRNGGRKISARCVRRTTPRNAFCPRDSPLRFRPATRWRQLAPVRRRWRRKSVQSSFNFAVSFASTISMKHSVVARLTNVRPPNSPRVWILPAKFVSANIRSYAQAMSSSQLPCAVSQRNNSIPVSQASCQHRFADNLRCASQRIALRQRCHSRFD